MKKRLAIMLMIASCSAAHAATEASNEAQSYIAGLCAMNGEQSATDASKETYVQKLKDMTARGSSPYAMDKPDFNEDEAEKVVDAWMKLPDEVKKRNLQDAEACKKATLEQYQKDD